MEDKYKSFSSSELAGEDSFMRWVRHGENHLQWTQWQQTHPECTSVIEEARDIVNALGDHEFHSLDNQSRAELWSRIRSNISVDGQKTNAQRQYRLLKWGLAAAATFALLIWFSSERAVRNVVVHSEEKE